MGLLSKVYKAVTNIITHTASKIYKLSQETMKMRGLYRQISIIIVTFGMIITNLILGGSEDNNSMYYVFFTAFSPAVYTFAIWGPIFLGFILFAIYQALPSHRRDDRLDAIAWPVIITCIAIAFTAFVKIGISNIVISIALVGVLFTYLIIIRFGPQDSTFSWLVRLPITILFGWITVATILNIFQFLNSLGIESFGQSGTLMASTFILIAAIIGLYITIRYNELVYGLVLIWAFWGIVAAHQSSILILLSTILSTIALLMAIAWNLLPYKHKQLIFT